LRQTHTKKNKVQPGIRTRPARTENLCNQPTLPLLTVFGLLELSQLFKLMFLLWKR